MWLPVVDYEGLYEVSSQARVRSLDRVDAAGRRRKGKVLKICLNGGGYPVVRLSKNGQGRTYTTAQLMLEAHVKPRPPEHEACHRDDVKTNSDPGNIYWGTHADNMTDRVRNGNHPMARKACPCGREYDTVTKAGRRLCSHCVREKERAKRRAQSCPDCGGPRNDVFTRADGSPYYYCATCRAKQMERARSRRAR
jgi:hypothetical protein